MSIKQVEGYTIYLSQVLGRGSFGNVYRGLKDITQDAVAVKIIPKELVTGDDYLMSSLRSEIRILQTVVSEHTVGFYDVMESANNYYIIQELCDCDLSKIIVQGQEMDEKQCVDILTQICAGFLALVREGIIHRDLKPANIMRRGKVYKIGDFGFSKQFTQTEINQQISMKSAVGTPLYMPVEILKSLNYSSKCDIWALGFIFYEMLHGETPWAATRQYQLVNNIENTPLKIKRKDLSPETVDFLKRCLQVYESDRICWNQVFIHPIFKGKFLGQADHNKQFENKMKSIMTRIRFHISLNRDGLENYLRQLGFGSKSQDLSFTQYFQFLRAVHPSITHNEAIYIFNKTDVDGSGTISLEEIMEMLHLHGIDLSSIVGMRESAEQKIRACFTKLNKIIVKNNLSLGRVFRDFDKKKKGYLTYEDFKTMALKLSKEITEEEVGLAFSMIDEDHSNSLEFAEICKHYWQINGLDVGQHL